jgi:hypothetical protein
LRWFARSGVLDTDEVREMPGWEKGGSSLYAQVWLDMVELNIRWQEPDYLQLVVRQGLELAECRPSPGMGHKPVPGE